MKLKIMTSEALIYVKKNISELISHYENGDDPQVWLSEAIDKPAFVEVPELEFDDFELIISEDTPSTTDTANIKLIYSKLIGLNDSFATDERLWAGLSHTLFFEYMQKRWPGKNDEKAILNHYFFNGGRPRCYMVNTLARLWWLGKKTYMSNYENPFEILDYISHDINGYSFTLFGSNWSNSERTLRLYFDAIFAYDKKSGERIGRELFNETMKYTNCLSGIYILDACDDDFIRNQIESYIEIRSRELKEEAEKNKINNVKDTGVEKLNNVLKAINKIGGHGKLADIVRAYEELTNVKASSATKDYIANSLDKNCPDRKSYSGKPMFYWIQISDGNVWKVSNEYLVRENLKNRKELMNAQISSLDSNSRVVFNLITAINKSKFTLEDLLQYSQQIKEVLDEADDVKQVIKDAIKILCAKGLIETMENGVYKKAFAIKVN